MANPLSSAAIAAGVRHGLARRPRLPFPRPLGEGQGEGSKQVFPPRGAPDEGPLVLALTPRAAFGRVPVKRASGKRLVGGRMRGERTHALRGGHAADAAGLPY
jgi:hypothetical protein